MYNYVKTKYLKESILVRDDNGSVAYTVFMKRVVLSFNKERKKEVLGTTGESLMLKRLI